MDEATRKIYVDRGRALMEARRPGVTSQTPERFEELRHQGCTIFQKFVEGGEWKPHAMQHHAPVAAAPMEHCTPHENKITPNDSILRSGRGVGVVGPIGESRVVEASLEAAASQPGSGGKASVRLPCEEDVSELRNIISAQKDQIDRLHCHLEQRESVILRLTGEVQEATAAINRIREENKQLKNDREALQKDKAMLVLEHERSSQEMNEQKFQLQELKELLKESNDELRDLYRQVDELREAEMKLADENSYLRQVKSQLENENLHLQRVNAELRDALDPIQTKIQVAQESSANSFQEEVVHRWEAGNENASYTNTTDVVDCPCGHSTSCGHDKKQPVVHVMTTHLDRTQRCSNELENHKNKQEQQVVGTLFYNPFASMEADDDASFLVRNEDDCDVLGLTIAPYKTEPPPERIAEHDELLRQKLEEAAAAGSGESVNSLREANEQLKAQLHEMEERHREELEAVASEAAERIAEHDELLRQKLEEAAAAGSGESINSLREANEQLKAQLHEMEERHREELEAVASEAAERIAEHDELLRQKLEEAAAAGSGESVNSLREANEQLKAQLHEMEERHREELEAVASEAAERIAEHDELLRQKLEEAAAAGSGESINSLREANEQLKAQLHEMEERHREELEAVASEAAERIAEHDELLRQKLEEAAAAGSGESINSLREANEQLKAQLHEMEERHREELEAVASEAAERIAEHDELLRQKLEEAAAAGSGESINSLREANEQLKAQLHEMEERHREELEAVASEAAERIAEHDELLRQKLEEAAAAGSGESVNSLREANEQLKAQLHEMEERHREELEAVASEAAERIAEHDELLRQKLEEAAAVGSGESINSLREANEQLKAQLHEMEERHREELEAVASEAAERIAEHDELLRQKLEEAAVAGSGESTNRDLHFTTAGDIPKLSSVFDCDDVRRELLCSTLSGSSCADAFSDKVLSTVCLLMDLRAGTCVSYQYLLRHFMVIYRKLICRCLLFENAATDALTEGDRQCQEFVAIVNNAETEHEQLLCQNRQLEEEVRSLKVAKEELELRHSQINGEHEETVRDICEKLKASRRELEVVKLENAAAIHKIDLLETENANVSHLFSEMKKTAAGVEDEQRREIVRLQEALREKSRSSREILECTERQLAAALVQVDQYKINVEDLEKKIRSSQEELDYIVSRLERAESERETQETKLFETTHQLQTFRQQSCAAEEASRRHAEHLSKTIEELQEVNAQLRESSSRQQRTLDSLRGQLAESELQIEALRARIKRQEDDAQHMHGRVIELESAGTLQVEESSAALQAAELRIASLEPSKAALQEELNQQQKNYRALQGDYHELESQLRQSADAYHCGEQQLKCRIQQLLEQVDAQEKELRRVKEMYSSLLANGCMSTQDRHVEGHGDGEFSCNPEVSDQEVEKLRNELRLQRDSYDAEMQAASITLNDAREELSVWRSTLERAEVKQNALRDALQMLHVERMTQDEEIRTLRHQLWGYQKSVTRGFGSPQLPGDMHTPPDSASLNMSASAEKRLIEKLQGIVAEKTMLLEERELQFETLHAEINDAIVQAVQEVSPAELSTEAEGNEEQREILLKNITHDLLLHFGCLTPTARGLHADGALPASYDDASVTTATGSQSNVGGAGSVLFTDTPTVSNTREGSENSIHE